jgi:CDP-4-dehydro-6-deoxyglucose reductase
MKMNYRVKLQPSGHEFDVAHDEFLLDAGLEAGWNLPYSCRHGMCRSCRAKIISGTVDMADYLQDVLTPAMRAQNITLLCCASPCSDLVIEVPELSLTTQKPKVVPCRVNAIERVTSDIVVVTLRLPQNENMRFAPGQYISILLNGGIRRAYSIASAPRSEGLINLELHIRHTPGGLFTDYLFNEMKLRSLLKFEGPMGTFYLREDSTKPILLLATGTGFAPIKSMVEYIANRNIKRSITFYWGGRSLCDLYMLDVANKWMQELDNFKFIPVLSQPRPEDEWNGRTGYIQKAITEDISDLSKYQVYACGNPRMVDEAKIEFEKFGLLDSEFFADAFVTEADRVRTIKFSDEMN